VAVAYLEVARRNRLVEARWRLVWQYDDDPDEYQQRGWLAIAIQSIWEYH